MRNWAAHMFNGLFRQKLKLSNSAFHPFEVDKWVVSCNRMCTASLGQCRMVNAYVVKAGWFIPFVDERVGGR